MRGRRGRAAGSLRRGPGPPASRPRATRRRGRAPVRPVGAELIESREILPGQWLQRLARPGRSSSGARAGPVRPRAHGRGRRAARCAARTRSPPPTPASGTLTIQVAGLRRGRRLGPRACGRATARTWSGRSGGRSRWIRGRATCCWSPRARPSPVSGSSSTRRSATDGRSSCCTARASSQRLPVEPAPGRGRVRRGHGGRDAGPPRAPWSTSSCDYEAWADQSFAAGPAGAAGGRSRGWRRVAGSGWASRRSDASGAADGRSRRARPEARRKAFLQVALDQSIGCAAGTCLGCVVAGVGRAGAGLPRGSRVRGGRARLGGRP